MKTLNKTLFTMILFSTTYFSFGQCRIDYSQFNAPYVENFNTSMIDLNSRYDFHRYDCEDTSGGPYHGSSFGYGHEYYPNNENHRKTKLLIPHIFF